MHIDHDSLLLENEADVEVKIIVPLLQGTAYLDIPEGRGCSVTEPLFLLSIKPLNDLQNLGNYFGVGNGEQRSTPSL